MLNARSVVHMLSHFHLIKPKRSQLVVVVIMDGST